MYSKEYLENMLNPTIEEDLPDYSTMSVTVLEDISPFYSRDKLTIIEEN